MTLDKAADVFRHLEGQRQCKRCLEWKDQLTSDGFCSSDCHIAWANEHTERWEKGLSHSEIQSDVPPFGLRESLIADGYRCVLYRKDGR